MWNKNLVVVVCTALFSLGVVWAPFFFKLHSFGGIDFAGTGMERIVQNFDGLNFLTVSKTWYDPHTITEGFSEILSGRKPLYFSAHYPGFPFLIAFIATVFSGPMALLLSIVAGNILLAVGLYIFFNMHKVTASTALWLSIIALFFPARMLADRSVGSNEPLFIFFVLISLVLFSKGRYLTSALSGAAAVLTRSPGILLFGAYFIYFASMKDTYSQKGLRYMPYLLIPAALLGLWTFYGYRFGSFFAYFQVGGNLNLYWPFAVFGSRMDWVSGIWNEDIIYLFLLLFSGISLYYKRYRLTPTSLFGILYGFFVLSVAHRDLARYSLPIIPLVVAGFSPYITNPRAKIIALVLVVPILLYTWQFVIANYQPISDWTPYL